MNTENILAALGNTGGGNALNRAINPPATNGLLGGGGGQSSALKALLEKLKRQNAYQGFDGLLGLLQLLDGGSLGNGGGGGGTTGGGTITSFCLRYDTPVSMADGSQKNAEDIRPGDVVMGFDPGIGNVPQEIMTVTIASQKCYKVTFDGGEIHASATHNWFMTDGDKLVIGSTLSLKPGLMLFHEDGTAREIKSVEPGEVATVYWWNCTPNQCYFAGGVLHHNASGGILPAYIDPKLEGPGFTGSKETTNGTGGVGSE